MIGPLTNEDRLPDERAVWRRDPCPPGTAGFIQVTIEFSDGSRERTFVDRAPWSHAARWRFGWAPAA